MAGCNQWAGELPLTDKDAHTSFSINLRKRFNLSIDRFTPFPYPSLDRALYRPSPPPGDPKIDIVPFPHGFDSEGRAIFPAPPEHRRKETAWKDECKPDLVILCTGYRQDWSWLGEGYPRGPEDCEIRGITSTKDLSIAFIGFVRPGVGAL